ncbi:translation initiation factor IF-2, mitochondrial-like [Mizuhopecten yessoensis]|uniref:Translation initiation factor IF-2, mitochondrial n=1 Tax=Mizuhopecten yessoensis TaxID=6573 RepID=A0A210QBC7_MIZYE|nr:translation initiation factor IF-2, mitochondrial-like [Mizuhopecten yessoensis]OWF46031.1 Translation initiation factor IF-2, mitochondrial [Mizuhopecten yessoensis]
MMLRQMCKRLFPRHCVHSGMCGVSVDGRFEAGVVHTSAAETIAMKQTVHCLPLQNSRGFHSSCIHNSKRSKGIQNRTAITYSSKKLYVPEDKYVKVPKGVSVKQFASLLNIDEDVIKQYYKKAVGGTDYEKFESRFQSVPSTVLMKSIGKSVGVTVNVVEAQPDGQILRTEEKKRQDKDIYPCPPPDPSVLVRRSPVVTIMGHVDHGKTSLLDSLRKTNVVEKEFGGITQHIGAFSVKLPSGEAITFLDTPGHAAFAAMRERGANVTDIVVLVVAADDGVMEQTQQSIKYANNAGVPIIVAINKIDKPTADVEGTKKMLLQYGIAVEDFGGDVQAIPVSAIQGTNLEKLREAIVTQAEIMELKADPVGKVHGHVIESSTDVGRGRLVTAVIERGTLRKGDLLIAGTAWAKVRQMFDENRKPLKEAPPATPVEITGWKELPSAGSEILQAASEAAIKEAIIWREHQLFREKENQIFDEIQEKQNKIRDVYVLKRDTNRLAGYFKRSQPKKKESEAADTSPQLAIVVKGDVDGSVEAILDCLSTYHSQQCRLDILRHDVGEVNTTDVETAQVFNGDIYAFNVKVPSDISKLAKAKGITIREHNVIYKMIDDIKDTMVSRIPQEEVEDVIGEANVIRPYSFNDGKRQLPVAGCMCVKGSLLMSSMFKVQRDGETLFRGSAVSLKHFKKEVNEIKKDMECGLRVTDDELVFQPGDSIVCYQSQTQSAKLDWDPGF